MPSSPTVRFHMADRQNKGHHASLAIPFTLENDGAPLDNPFLFQTVPQTIMAKPPKSLAAKLSPKKKLAKPRPITQCTERLKSSGMRPARKLILDGLIERLQKREMSTKGQSKIGSKTTKILLLLTTSQHRQ